MFNDDENIIDNEDEENNKIDYNDYYENDEYL